MLIAGVPSSQALSGFFITAPASVCVPDVIGVRAVWIQNQKKEKKVFEPPCHQGPPRHSHHRAPSSLRTHALLRHKIWLGVSYNSGTIQKGLGQRWTTHTKTRGGILLAIRKNSFATSEKIHHQTDLYQTATWTLSAGGLYPHHSHNWGLSQTRQQSTHL